LNDKINKVFAEKTRFELVVDFYIYDGLANRWFKPLTHFSNKKIPTYARENTSDLAEEEGFEPPERFHVHLFSRQAQ
jgi:hypothetical protein